MEVISINVNNFGGRSCKPLLNDYKLSDKKGDFNWSAWNKAVDSWRGSNSVLISANVNRIVKLLKDFDVAFLHEVDTNCASWTQLHELMDAEYQYEIANEKNKSDYDKKGRNSISCVFIKKGIDYLYKEITNFSGYLRNVEIEINGVRFIGVHANTEKKWWDGLEKRVEQLQKDFIILGDFNVYKKEGYGKAVFDRLLQNRVTDLWINQGGRKDTPTYVYNTRVDYALASKSMIESGAKEFILNDLMTEGVTDHAAIAVSVPIKT